MAKSLKYILFILTALTTLTACGGRPEFDVDVVATLPSDKIINQKIEVKRIQPQFYFEGRGFSFASIIENPDIGFNIIIMPIVIEEVERGARTYCGLLDGEISKFVNFSETRAPNVKKLIMYFNCEYTPKP